MENYVFLAYLDILGFSAMVEKNEHNDLINIFYRIESCLFNTQKRFWKIDNNEAVRDLSKFNFNVIIISDSIIIHTNTTIQERLARKNRILSILNVMEIEEDASLSTEMLNKILVDWEFKLYADQIKDFNSINDILNLLDKENVDLQFRYLVKIIQQYIHELLYNGHTVRGAVSFGELSYRKHLLRTNNQANIIDNTMMVGKALVNAAKLEKRQDWAGCVIDKEVIKVVSPGVLNDQINCKILCKYDVPLKKSEENDNLVLKECETESMYVIDWRFGNGNQNPPSERLVSGAFEKHGKTINNSVDSKRKNTLEFLNASKLQS
ncbi:MAG TPA: hypothetical protein VKR58_12805 [Aquella sp.]|nr:hypothetical protein [Aquella sp.]